MNTTLPATVRHSYTLTLLVLLVLITTMLPLAVPAQARAIIRVNSPETTVDSSDNRCTLHEAVKVVNDQRVLGVAPGECGAPGADGTRIVFAGDYTITFDTNDPTIEIKSDIQIEGSDGFNSLNITIDGGAQQGTGGSRIFFVTNGTVRLTNLTIRNGAARGGNGGAGAGGGGGGGGGAGLGGGLFVNNGDVTVERVTFMENVAEGGDGGAGSAFSGQYGGGGGGGGAGTAGSPANGQIGGRGGDGLILGGLGGDGGIPGGTRSEGSGGSGRGDGGGGGGSAAATVGVGGDGGNGLFGAGGGGVGNHPGPANPTFGFSGSGGFGGGGGGGAATRGAANGGGAFAGGGQIGQGGVFGGAGGGGAGLGGAVFVRDGRLTIIGGSFLSNEALRGVIAGDVGVFGEGKGGAVFVADIAQAFIVGTPTFAGNSADDAQSVTAPSGFNDNSNFYGTITAVPLVSVDSQGEPSRVPLQTGSFIIRRTGPIGQPLSVKFTVGGSATKNTDFAISHIDSITIPAQSLTATVVLTPTLFEAPRGRTVDLRLDPDDAYAIGSPVSARLTIDGDHPLIWLVMLYIAADDIKPVNASSSSPIESLDDPARDLLARLNNMPDNPYMRLVVLFDGVAKNREGGDSRIYVRQPTSSTEAGATVGRLVDVTEAVVGSSLWPDFPVSSDGKVELDTGRVSTLQSFIAWSRGTFPGARHTMLSIVNHGGGWAPSYDDVSQPRGKRPKQPGSWRGLSIDYGFASSLSTRDTGKVFEALGEVGQLDVLFFDACLMGMIESAYEIQPHVRYLIAGQNLLWAALPYETYLSTNIINDQLPPDVVAEKIVDAYSEAVPEPHTIAAWNMAQLPQLRFETDLLAKELLAALDPAQGTNVAEAEQRLIDAYIGTQKFDYNVDLRIDSNHDGYVDLADFAEQIRSNLDWPKPVRDAASMVVVRIKGADKAKRVILRSGPPREQMPDPSEDGALIGDLSKASGVSIYLPLGEQDCRPVDIVLKPESDDPKNPLICSAEAVENGYPLPPDTFLERQLAYYVRPEQLAFVRDAPNWPRLLQRMEKRIPELEATRRFYDAFQLHNRWEIALPLVMNQVFSPNPAADLVATVYSTPPAGSVLAGTPLTFIVTVTNQGTIPAEGFWVDLYIDPVMAPVGGQAWNELCPRNVEVCEGIAWYMDQVLEPGQSITVRSTSDSYVGPYTSWSGKLPVGSHDMYVYVDSWRTRAGVGAVAELNELNNRAELLDFQVAAP